MRILILTSTYEPLTGGAETYARTLAQGLVKRGHEVVLVTDGSWLHELPYRSNEQGIDVVRLRYFANEIMRRDRVVWREMHDAIIHEINELLRGQNFDVVHANSHETLTWAACIAQSIPNCRLVASLHEQSPEAGAYGVGKCLVAYKYLPVDRFVAASRYYYDRALAMGADKDRVVLIYHGILPPSEISGSRRCDFRRSLGVPADANLVLCPARIYTRKGQIYLARAIPGVLKEFPSVRFLLAGRSSDVEYYSEVRGTLRANGCETKVIFREDFTHDDMSKVFASSDVVVQPSLEEGLGLAVIEAMSYGLPIVCSDVTGLNELVTDGQNGRLVPHSDVGALRDAMISVLADHNFSHRISQGARETYEDRFTQRRMVEQTEALYAEI